MSLARTTGVLVVVPPGPLAAWSLRLLTRATKLAHVPINRIDRTDAIVSGGPPAVFICEFPGPSAIAAVTQGLLEAVYVLADPQWTVAVHVASGKSLLEALRLATASATANLAIGRSARSRIVYPETQQKTGLAAQRLLTACGLSTEPNTLHEILTGLGMVADAEFRSTLSQFGTHVEPPPLDPASSATTQSVLAGLSAMVEGLTNVPIVWPTAVFLSGDQPDSPAPTVASVVGPSRVVIYGPYLHLPPATYRGEVIMAFSGRIEEIAFQLDFRAGQSRLTSLRMEGRKSGAYRGQFKLVVADPNQHIEIHLRNERGSIEGEVALQELRFYVDEPESSSFS